MLLRKPFFSPRNPDDAISMQKRQRAGPTPRRRRHRRGRVGAPVEGALAAGSLGAEITGGGMGGCVIAPTRPEQASTVTRRLHEAGAVQTWVVPLRGIAGHGH
ncbi:hypothetical protein AB0N81_17650 [Streptomyces sp. NPDC093510]|uniref:hypothetical protein n=1 Tax=Streptomyces sp. NPDC093510 TaxID=3155199 RepID=UPI003439ECA1